MLSFASSAFPDQWGPFDSFADSLAQGDMGGRSLTHRPLALTGACRARHCAGTTFRLLVAWMERGPSAWLSFRREKVPGTAPIASLGARGPPLPPRGRPPASHRRGRSPVPTWFSHRGCPGVPPLTMIGVVPRTARSPRSAEHRSRTARPVDANPACSERHAGGGTPPRPFRKRQAPSLQNRLRLREGGGCPPQDPLPLPPHASRKRNHRLAALRRRPRHDLAPAPPVNLALRGGNSPNMSP